MGYPRNRYFKEGQEGVFHCVSRCVRRAFLCGYDAVTRRDYSHRKKLLIERLRFLSTIFAIEVCNYAVMENHYHLIVRICLDMCYAWSDREVAIRWLTLFPRRKSRDDGAIAPREEDINAIILCPELVEKLRKRLCSLSWFMGRLNEYLARIANKEDEVKGRFWEGRFKCQELLDESAIASCMIYVDLNPIRAGVAATPEESNFTGIQERIQSWQRETTNSAFWLCPISSDAKRRGILQMTEAQYFDLVDRSGRLVYPGKPGVIDAGLAPILQRIGVDPKAWINTISEFGTRFHVAAGTLANMRRFADRIGRRWIKGLSAARAAFAPCMSDST